MRKVVAVGTKELRQILRDRRTLLILLFIPAFFLLLYGYALNFDIRNVSLVVKDQDRSTKSRELVSAFVNSGYFNLVGYVDSDREIDRLIDEGRVRTVLTIPSGLARRLALRQPVVVQVIIDGDNANTASVVMGYARALVGEYSAAQTAPVAVSLPGAPIPTIAVEPRVWYNPQLRSTLFLVPGLIAYIAMITAVVSTALSVVREKERGTMEQVRMAPIGPLPYIIGKTLPYLAISFVSALMIIFSAMLLFELPMRGSWWLLCGGDRPVPGRRSGPRPADLDDRANPAGRVPGGAALVAVADDDPVGVHLSDPEHARCGAGHHAHRAGALLHRGAAVHRAEGRPTSPRSGRTWWRSPSSPRWPWVSPRFVSGGSGATDDAESADRQMKRVLHLMRKELLELKQDPRLFGIVVMAPIIQLTVLGYAATTDVKDIPIVVVDTDRSTASRELMHRFEASDNFKIVGMPGSTGEIDRYLDRGEAWMALSIPPDYGRKIASGQKTTCRSWPTARTPTPPAWR